MNEPAAIHTQSLTLTAGDGHRFHAYQAGPADACRAVVIVQEIFGVNRHIRSVAEDYAREGFLAIAPALFDRVERGVEYGYDGESARKGKLIAEQIAPASALRDIDAALRHAGGQVGERAVAVVGYCWGGSLAWLSATRLNPAAAVGYYGGQIAQYAGEQPSCPTLLHFGARDAHIAPEKVTAIREAHPEIPIHIYDAPHGFNCNDRAEYTPEAAREAKGVTLKFLRSVLKD